MPDITYVAVKPLTIAGERREVGELVPEAESWRNVAAYVSNGTLAPVPKDSVDSSQLQAAEDRRETLAAKAQAEAPRLGGQQVSDEDVEELTEENTKEELYDEAQDLDIEGRSKMDKEELAEAVAEARAEEQAQEQQEEQPEQAQEQEPEQEQTQTQEPEETSEGFEDEGSRETGQNAAADLDDELEQYHVGSGWYKVPGRDKKLRRDDALEALTTEDEDEE